MKLNEFLKTIGYFGDDYITVIHMDNMFKEISSNNSRFIYVTGGLEQSIVGLEQSIVGLEQSIVEQSTVEKSTVEQSTVEKSTVEQSTVENSVTILSINPDSDFPKPKKSIVDKYNDSMPFIEEQQCMLDIMDYYDKVDIEVLDKIDNKINKIYVHSVGKLHPKVNMIPIGRDFKNNDLFDYVDGFCKEDKSILCYYNVTLPPDCFHWYGMIRRYIYEIVMNKDFIKKQMCDVHPRTYSHEKTIDYYKDLSKSKFAICPRGTGIDTYRLWDSIHMGCIPIVEKYEGYQQFEDLPILFIDHLNELCNYTSEFLELKWLEMIDKEYNYDKLRLSYWKNRILTL